MTGSSRGLPPALSDSVPVLHLYIESRDWSKALKRDIQHKLLAELHK